jgi:hypothetical protein
VTADVLAVRSLDGGDAHQALLLGHLRDRGIGGLRFPKVHPAEMPSHTLSALGFRPAGAHVLYATRAGRVAEPGPP